MTLWFTGFLIQRTWVQNHCVAPKSTQPFILPRSIKWVPGTPEDWVVKSKLYFYSSAPFWQMGVIHILSLSRYLKKHVQFYKMQGFWISKKRWKYAESAEVKLKPGCIQTFENLEQRSQFTMSFFLSEIYFKIFDFFFLTKGSKWITMYNISTYFHLIFFCQKLITN